MNEYNCTYCNDWFDSEQEQINHESKHEGLKGD